MKRSGRRHATSCLAVLLAMLAFCPAALHAEEPANPLPAALAEGLSLTAGNERIQLTVTGLAAHDSLGTQSRRNDHYYLLIDTRWKALGEPGPGQEHPQHRLANLEEQVYLVVNDHLLRHRTTARNMDDLLPDELIVPAPDAEPEESIEAMRTGKLAFAVPRDMATEQLELHVLDRHGGNFKLLLHAPESGPIPPAEPVVPLASHRQLTAGVFGMTTPENDPVRNSRLSNDDQTWLVLDLRARSLREIDTIDILQASDAELAESPLARSYFEWANWTDRMQLVFDGEHGFHPENHSYQAMPSTVRFLPEATTGEQITFRVPSERLEEASSVELLLSFDQAAMPRGEAVADLEPLRFTLRGKRPTLDTSAEQPLATVQDLDLRLDVLNAATSSEPIKGHHLRRDHEWLVLDLRVTAGKRDATFDPQHLWLVAPDGERLIPHRNNDNLLQRAPNRRAAFWLPAGETRRFQLVWMVGEAHRNAPLFYEGLTRTAFLDLPGRASPVSAADIATTNIDVLPNREPGGIESVGLTPEQVNTAIDSARDYLWKELREQSDWFDSQVGQRLPALLALVHADAHEEYPEFDARLRDFLDHIRPPDTGSRTIYGTGLLAMLVESYGDPLYLPLLEQCARYLIEDQGPEGTWNYNAIYPQRFFPEIEAPEPSPFSVTGGRSLEPVELPTAPLRRTLPWGVNNDGDNSVTQYAVLGLWSAQRAGIPVDREVWQRLLRATWDRQGTNRGNHYSGWAYNRSGRPYGSMTAAGVCAAALAMHYLDRNADPKQDPRLRGALAWLAEQWEMGIHPQVGGNEQTWLYYYLYSIERVGQILGSEFIGEHEWYPALARWLIDNQRPAGSWSGQSQESRGLLATSFALLCLTRATPSLDVEDEPIERGGEGQLVTDIRLPAPERAYLILDASGSLREEHNGRMMFDYLREAMRDVVRLLPEGTHVALRVYGHQYLAVDPQADEDTRLEIPMGPLDHAAFEAKLAELQPRGKTPLALTLRETARDLSRLRPRPSEDAPVLLVIVADGEEHTWPRQDPIAAAHELAEVAGVNAHIVGFDVNDPQFAQRLHQITEILNGHYHHSQMPEDVARTMTGVVHPTPPPFQVLDEAGQVIVEAGTFGKTITLPEGHYTFRSMDMGEPVEVAFWLNTNSTTRIRFDASGITYPHSPRTAAQPPTAEPATPPAASPTPAPTPSGSRFCMYCGQPVQPDDRFCGSCGEATRQ